MLELEWFAHGHSREMVRLCSDRSSVFRLRVKNVNQTLDLFMLCLKLIYSLPFNFEWYTCDANLI